MAIKIKNLILQINIGYKLKLNVYFRKHIYKTIKLNTPKLRIRSQIKHDLKLQIYQTNMNNKWMSFIIQ